MKRRRFSSDFKLQCVLDMVSGRKSPAQICREHNISESSLSRWRQQFIEGAPKIFENGSSARSAEAQRIAELERLVGKLTLELEASKKLLSYFPSR
jgi:transposase